MGYVALLVLISFESIFMVWSIVTKKDHSEEKSVVRLSELVLLMVLLVTGIFQWGFRYLLILIVLIIQSAMAVATLIRKKERTYRLKKEIISFIRSGFIYSFALFIAILCPQYSQFEHTGNYEIATAKYTWVDSSRIEQFSDTGEKRSLTVDFWYPKNGNENCPLVVFSHGAYGFSGSNVSTFEDLASNGYVVASIGHTYHAFFTKDTSGKITPVSMDFMNSVNELNADDDAQRDYLGTRDWMKLRVDDENFVIDTIINEAKSQNSDMMFKMIDTNKIGAIGHSLGGASSVEIGRERNDIDAVVDLDGTMLGEEIGFENGAVILNDTAYKVPLLDIYAEDHFNNAMTLAGENYDNFYVDRNAICSYQVVFKDAGHLNFTDLPMFSPPLAKMLGIGTIDRRYCIEKTNALVLEFFDCYLKDGATPQFEKEY